MSTNPDPDDLTARARIRDAAIAQFGELGFERATIRGIAAAAGVSSGLVRHHFGSKQALREACDEQLTKIIRRLDDQAHAFPNVGIVNPATEMRPYQAYLVRTLTDGATSPIFDDMVELSTRWLEDLDRADPNPPRSPARARAAILTAMSLAVGVLRPHVSRGIGADLSTPEGEELLLLSLVDLYSRPMLSTAEATRIQAALDEQQAGRAAGPGKTTTSRRSR
ncbi:TetR/AcrR family transcriptional regulator [Microlunatus speluncae]|uniref:TetR/AcrR family transcriptional regulator n=1 Tax=Microlunatus speluncae TaxID=2594267 RepID=UPI0012662269|nr:TetR/AcrR family transcriptional regulator [Microlunatus speluncae]